MCCACLFNCHFWCSWHGVLVPCPPVVQSKTSFALLYKSKTYLSIYYFTKQINISCMSQASQLKLVLLTAHCWITQAAHCRRTVLYVYMVPTLKDKQNSRTRDVIMSRISENSRVGSLWPTVVYIRINYVYVCSSHPLPVSRVFHYSPVTSLLVEKQVYNSSSKWSSCKKVPWNTWLLSRRC